ncbi:Sucrose-6-phosphate hydrolase [Klebsiella pneumoniae]|uniref:Sucrose-6-phosphate hydrolase n=1 Tax=Klebsiella pneumoniae TaxID=573 RepID=A0A378ASA2_KLEPN|nr:Sucrose-6-phosphate hydrolase [Klebsiella pneumoniae]
MAPSASWGRCCRCQKAIPAHVRDPKVWRQDGRWYMVLGAQDVQQRGKVLLFTASDLRECAWWARSPGTT